MSAGMPKPPLVGRATPDDECLAQLNAMAAGDADAFCAARIDAAIAEWRMQDALAWQRLRFRSRFRHALARRAGPTA